MVQMFQAVLLLLKQKELPEDNLLGAVASIPKVSYSIATMTGKFYTSWPATTLICLHGLRARVPVT